MHGIRYTYDTISVATPTHRARRIPICTCLCGLHSLAWSCSVCLLFLFLSFVVCQLSMFGWWVGIMCALSQDLPVLLHNFQSEAHLLRQVDALSQPNSTAAQKEGGVDVRQVRKQIDALHTARLALYLS